MPYANILGTCSKRTVWKQAGKQAGSHHPRPCKHRVGWDAGKAFWGTLSCFLGASIIPHNSKWIWGGGGEVMLSKKNYKASAAAINLTPCQWIFVPGSFPRLQAAFLNVRPLQRLACQSIFVYIDLEQCLILYATERCLLGEEGIIDEPWQEP